MSKTYETKFVEFTEIGKIEMKTKEINSINLSPTECIIQNEASIISAGTELAVLNGLQPDTTFPTQPGYGAIGTILEKGSAITDFAVGDRVFYAGKHASIQRFNHGEPHQWAYLFPIPDGLDPITGSVGCMAEIAMTAPNMTNLKLGDTVVVYGLGVVGLLAAMMYQIRGAHVIGVDPVSHRCALAKKLGISTVVDVQPAQQVEELMKITKGRGAEVTVDAAGHAAVIQTCIKTTALFGQVILLGTARAPFQGNVTEAFHIIHMNSLTVRGAHMWQYPVDEQRGVAMDVKWAFRTIFNLIHSKQLNVRPLISHVIKPDEIPDAYEGLQHKQEEYTCAVIDWRL
ncbi:MAG: zinc-binding dehydrogenase [Clostridia bacterium]